MNIKKKIQQKLNHRGCFNILKLISSLELILLQVSSEIPAYLRYLQYQKLEQQFQNITIGMEPETLKVFILTFLGYASLTSLRYGWSYSKAQLNEQFGVSMKQLGIVDACYIIFYSSGMVVLGSIVHKFSLKNYVVTGVLVSSLSYMFFSVFYSLTSIYSFAIIAVCMSIFGFFQAAVYPGLMGVLGNWLDRKKNGVVMAIWVMSGNVGNIFASSTCNVLEENDLSWIVNFLVTGLAGVAVAALIYQFLKQKPQVQNKQGQILANNQQQEGQKHEVQPEQDNFKYGIFDLVSYPRVPAYIIGLACLKGCVYGLIFWLPTFLDSKGSLLGDQKGYISSMVDVGGLIGIFSLGYFADKYDKRAVLLSPLLFIASIMMCLISFALTEPWQYYLSMFLMGLCTVGPYNMICTVIAIDLGHRINKKDSVTKISSLIEGVAAFSSAIEMVLIPFIPFDTIFYLFSAECVIATIILYPLFIEELKEFQTFKFLSKTKQTNLQSIQMNLIKNPQSDYEGNSPKKTLK